MTDSQMVSYHEFMTNAQRAYIISVLAQNANNVTRAARKAGVNRTYLRKLMVEHGLGHLTADSPGARRGRYLELVK